MNRKDRRALKKNTTGKLIVDDSQVWHATSYNTYSKPERQKPEPDIPGITSPPVMSYHNQMVESNIWYSRNQLDEIINTIKQISHKEQYEEDGNTLKSGVTAWSWARNWNCKYINLRFDMRDGGFVMTNDKGQRICLEQLMWQYKTSKGESPDG